MSFVGCENRQLDPFFIDNWNIARYFNRPGLDRPQCLILEPPQARVTICSSARVSVSSVSVSSRADEGVEGTRDYKVGHFKVSYGN
jgi:hypothetical protein